MKIVTRGVLIGVLLYLSGFSIIQGVDRTVYALDHMRASEEEMRAFVHVYDEVLENYVDVGEASPESLMQGAIFGMLQTLDPYSQFFPPTEYKKFTEQTQGEFGGLGIRIVIAGPNARWLPGWLTVVEPIEGTPATKCKTTFEGVEYLGLKPDDKIVEIEGEPTRGMSLDKAVDKLKGAPGTSVKIQIARKPIDGGDPIHPLDFTIERDTISVPPIEEDNITMISSDIAYVWLKDFTSHAHEALEAAIEKLREEGMKALILDLRDNTGGLLPVAIEICDLFVDEGQTIVSVNSRNDRDDEAYKARRPMFTDVPVAILVNQNSASASEIVAGCIQDHERGVVVGPEPGVNTYGKGSVQTVLKLEDGSGLKLTTAYYYTPKEQKIHNHGIEPDAWSDLTPEYWMRLREADKVGYLKPGMLPNQVEEKKKDEKGEITVGELLGQTPGVEKDVDLYDKQLFLAAQLLNMEIEPSEEEEKAVADSKEGQKEG